MNFKRYYAFLLLASTTAACSHLEWGTLWEYRNVDFYDVNPDTTRVALELPEGLGLEKALVSLEGTVDGNPLFSGKVDLEIIHAGPEMVTLPSVMDPKRSFVLRVPRDQIANARELQLQVQAFQNMSDNQGEKGFSLGFEVGSNIDGSTEYTVCDYSMSVWVKLEDAERYSRLASEKAFKKIFAESMEQNACDAAAR